MADIKLTLSSDPHFRSQSIEEEAEWLRSQGRLQYPLQVGPKEDLAGSWAYFIRAGRLVGRARISRVVPSGETRPTASYTGVSQTPYAHAVECKPPLEVAAVPLPHDGFQGFRYVRHEERPRFEKAFTGRVSKPTV